jgi:hypothetical protein
MIRIHQLFRFFMIIGMALVLSFSLSPSSFEENVSDTETSQGSVTTGLHVAKTFIRQPVLTFSKLVFHNQELPLLFMVYLLEILIVPSFWHPFKHCIMLLLRRLFLDPIKYTSTYVSRGNLSVL